MTVPKYKNHRCPGIAPDGSQRTYDSQREAVYSVNLFNRCKAGEIASWRPQVRIKLTVAGRPLMPFEGKRQGEYVADFVVTLADGTVEVIDVKGYQDDKAPVTRLWRYKLGIVQLMHPEWTIRIVK